MEQRRNELGLRFLLHWILHCAHTGGIVVGQVRSSSRHELGSSALNSGHVSDSSVSGALAVVGHVHSQNSHGIRTGEFRNTFSKFMLISSAPDLIVSV